MGLVHHHRVGPPVGDQVGAAMNSRLAMPPPPYQDVSDSESYASYQGAPSQGHVEVY